MNEDLRLRLVELLQDVKEIKSAQIELIKQGAVHNELLRTHEARSLALQARIEPIEKHVSFVDKYLKFIGAVAAGALVQWIARTLL